MTDPNSPEFDELIKKIRVDVGPKAAPPPAQASLRPQPAPVIEKPAQPAIDKPLPPPAQPEPVAHSLADRDAPAARPNQTMCFIGAGMGAAVGAGMWMFIGYATGWNFGIIATLIGVLAGLGAVALGGGRGPEVGVIAAAAAVLGIMAGSYGTYLLIMRGVPDAADYSYFKWMASSPSHGIFLLIVSGLGIGAGFRIGSGQGKS